MEGARFSNTYINSVVLSDVELPLLVNWITYSRTAPLLLDGAVHEMVMLVKVVMPMLKTTFSGAAVGKTNLLHVYAWFAQQHQTLPIPLVIACNDREKSPMPASFSAAIMSVYLVQDASPVS